MNYTVYIRKQNWLKFEQEEKKAELINSLLSKHYGDAVIKPKEWAVEPKIDSSSLRSELPPTFKKGVNLCKVHNLPLTVYGKCLQKGCKNG